MYKKYFNKSINFSQYRVLQTPLGVGHWVAYVTHPWVASAPTSPAADNTEFGSLSGQGDGEVDKPADDIHDTHEQSSFIIATIDQLSAAARHSATFKLPTTLSYWTFSDIMNEENACSKLGGVSRAPGWATNASFHGGFGLVNAFGVPKPSFRAYQLLHQAHDFQQPVLRTNTSEGAPASTAVPSATSVAAALCAQTTGVVATMTGADHAGHRYNDVDIILTRIALLASTDTLTSAPYRVVYITLHLPALSALLCPKFGGLQVPSTPAVQPPRMGRARAQPLKPFGALRGLRHFRRYC